MQDGVYHSVGKNMEGGLLDYKTVIAALLPGQHTGYFLNVLVMLHDSQRMSPSVTDVHRSQLPHIAQIQKRPSESCSVRNACWEHQGDTEAKHSVTITEIRVSTSTVWLRSHSNRGAVHLITFLSHSLHLKPIRLMNPRLCFLSFVVILL